jgi:plasmid maintenance system antidote protein VapI
MSYMQPAKRKPTMTELLRQTMTKPGRTFLGIEQATGVKRQSLMKFARGEQSLRLDLADRLAAYFGIEVRRKGR